jgi:DNA-binding IclR family transcriptional regulator
MSIPFTQYMRPDGRKEQTSIDRPDEIERLASLIRAHGYRFESECLGTATLNVSLTIFDPAMDEDVAIELCNNGPDVLAAVDKLVTEFAKKIGISLCQ